MQTLNILVLWPKCIWESKMSSARRHSIWAMKRREDVNLTLTGIGFGGYDKGASVAKNVARIMPDADIIMAYKPEGHTREHTPPVIGLREVTQPVVLRFNEAWWGNNKAAKEVEYAGASLVICHHPGDVRQFKSCTARIEVIPHCAEKSVYGIHTKTIEQRQVDVMFVGVQAEGTYPLRYRWWNLIKAGLPAGIIPCIYPHPGYWANDIEHCEWLVREYAAVLGKAKIVLACTSLYKYPLAKYVEGAMAGTVIVGDAPDLCGSDRFPSYDKLFFPVDVDASKEKLIRTLQDLLADKDRLQEIATTAKQTAMEFYSQETYAEQFVTIAREVVEARP